MTEGIHSKHRERVRKEFLEHGFIDATPNHKLIEMLLFYSIPRKDTNELAHTLINRFGSLSALLEADPKELLKVEGVGENTASLIKLIMPIARAYQNEKGTDNVKFNNMDELCGFLMKKYFGFTKEVFSLISFDSRGKLIGFDILNSGDITSVAISTRNVIETVLKRNAVCVILAHNHPDGNALPSTDDITSTERINSALKTINVRLMDHIILATDDYVSLAQSDYYRYLFT